MNRFTFALLGLLLFSPAALPAAEEPTTYVIQKGDTMWGLSERFFKDPYYWPNLWSKNPEVTNPHLIYPGQQLRIYKDRVESVPKAKEDAQASASAPQAAPAASDVIAEKAFRVTGGEGLIIEEELLPAGRIIGIDRNRNIAGKGDLVFVDIGKKHGAKVGDRYTVFVVMEPLTHPKNNYVIGKKGAVVGALQITEVAKDSARAVVTASAEELTKGMLLFPYREPQREIPLKAASVPLTGVIVGTRHGNRMIGAGEIIYLDMGRAKGLEKGNMLYVVRDVELEVTGKKPEEIPVEVLGALVVVETGEKTSTAIVIKSSDAFYPGDRVETVNKP